MLLNLQMPAGPEGAANPSSALAAGGLTIIHGETLLRAIRKRFPERNARSWGHEVPVFIVSAYASDADFVSGMLERGADSFVAKPFDAKVETISAESPRRSSAPGGSRGVRSRARSACRCGGGRRPGSRRRPPRPA